MNIMVYDVAAENRGAATILEYYYSKHIKDKDNHYFYLLSVYEMKDADNITVINVPKVKRGWGSRLAFDLFGVKKYIEEYRIEKILSLQNTIVPAFKGTQIVYEHNALPFSEHRFKLIEDKVLWIYQNVIGKYMIWSIKKASRVLVQTKWMKNSIVKKTGVNPEKIDVQFPQVELPDGYTYTKQNNTTFFYPANAAIYKNHKVIIDACKHLKAEGITNYKIVFTLRGDENINVAALKKVTDELCVDVDWKGTIAKEEVFRQYEKSVLLFPSFIETVGLPIYEAKHVNTPMILADCPYSREIANDYNNARFFNYKDGKQLAKLMKDYIMS